MEYSTQLFTGRLTSSFDMLCALKSYVEKAKKVIFAKMAHTGVLSGSDDTFCGQTDILEPGKDIYNCFLLVDLVSVTLTFCGLR